MKRPALLLAVAVLSVLGALALSGPTERTDARPAPADPEPMEAPVWPQESTQRYAMAYVVQPGDTLAAIAQRFGTSVQALASMNGLDDPDLIFAGDRLLIAGQPDALQSGEQRVRTAYTTQPGDTLRALAERFGTTVDAIAATNGIDDPDRLAVGVELVIP